VLSLAMILHHHLHSSAQKMLWSSNAGPLSFLNSLAHAPPGASLVRQPKVSRLRLHRCCYHLFLDRWCDHLAPPWVLIGVGDRGSWSRVPHRRRRHCIDVGIVLLTHLLFYIRVTEDDNLADAGLPEKTAVEVGEEPPSKFLILRGIREDALLI
jgi:hypothetical protein